MTDLRITGPNSDGEYWLHIKAGGKMGGFNLGSEHGPLAHRLLDAAAIEAPNHLALVAAAYRDAADKCVAHSYSNNYFVSKALHDASTDILARTPADAEAHLTALLRAEYESGVQDAVQVIDERLDGVSTYGEWAQGWITGVNWARKDILALLTQEGR